MPDEVPDPIPTSVSVLPMFQWSYRDLSTLKSDESNLADLDRTNETLLPKGTKIQIKVEVVKNGKTYSITKDYTITAEDVAAATWVEPVPNHTVTFDTNGGTGTASAQTVANGEKATAPENIAKTDYTLDGWYNGDDKWDFASNTVSNDITLTAKWTPALISVDSQPFVSIAEKKENDPYPLMKFSYNRLADGAKVELKVTNGNETATYFYEGDTFEKANSAASFTWSMRDLSSTATDGGYTKNGADVGASAIERANDKIIPVDTVLTYTLTATKDSVTQTITGTYKVTQSDFDKVFYVSALVDPNNLPSGMIVSGTKNENTINLVLTGTVTSGVPETLKDYFYKAGATVESQDALTTAIGEHTVISIPFAGLAKFETGTNYKTRQTNPALMAYKADNNITEDTSNGTWVKVPIGAGTSGTNYANVCYAMLITPVDGTKLELCTTTTTEGTETLTPVVTITINASGLKFSGDSVG